MNIKEWFDSKKNIRRLMYSIMSLVIVYNLISFIASENWSLVFFTVAITVLLFIPLYISKKTKFPLPIELELMTAIFLFLHFFLGEVTNYYEIYSWWNRLLHFSSGILLALIGFVIIYLLYGIKKLKTTPLIIILFSFCFAVALGGLWEIVEFFIDMFFNKNMQPSLYDTNMDLIMDSLGALISSAGIYWYSKSKFKPLEKLIKHGKESEREEKS